MDKNSWKPCPRCEPKCIACDNSLTRANCGECDGFSNFKPCRDPLRFRFCPDCGRPYVKEAWDELEERMQGTPNEPSPNEPMTLDELRQMALEEWVWIAVILPQQVDWDELGYYRKLDNCRPEEVFSCGYPGWGVGFNYKDYGITWRAYRRRPEDPTP